MTAMLAPDYLSFSAFKERYYSRLYQKFFLIRQVAIPFSQYVHNQMFDGYRQPHFQFRYIGMANLAAIHNYDQAGADRFQLLPTLINKPVS